MISINNTVQGDVNEISLVGRLDVKAAKDVEQAFEEAASQPYDVVLDLTELDYIASAGLRALKRLNSAVSKNGHELTLRGVQPDVMDVFELTGFAAILNFG